MRLQMRGNTVVERIITFTMGLHTGGSAPSRGLHKWTRWWWWWQLQMRGNTVVEMIITFTMGLHTGGSAQRPGQVLWNLHPETKWQESDTMVREGDIGMKRREDLWVLYGEWVPTHEVARVEAVTESILPLPHFCSRFPLPHPDDYNWRALGLRLGDWMKVVLLTFTIVGGVWLVYQWHILWWEQNINKFDQTKSDNFKASCFRIGEKIRVFEMK